MKKITSFLTLMVLCSVVALAQEVVGSELPTDKQIKIGTAQAEVVPGKWYVVYNPRPSAGSSLAQDFVLPGESIPWTGGLVVDMGAGERVRKSQTVIIDEMNSENGVNANDYMNYLVRFCVPDSLEGVYNVQFGTGNWLASQLSSVSSQSDAGMYNFYLVTINDIPNSFGRFGWNKFDMADRVDNNGAGNTVAFWDSGIITGESENWTSAEQISANKIWQIFDIHILGDADIYAYALEDLLDEYTRITGSQDGAFIENLQNGVNVGTFYGNYRPEDVAAFLTIQANVENLMFTWEMDGREAVQVQYPNTDDLNALIQEYSGAYDALEANKIPLAMTSIAPGYYTINSMMNWYETKNDTIFLTQEEADSINNENGFLPGDGGYAEVGGVKEIVTSQVEAPIKSLCSRDNNAGQGWLAWGTQEPKAEYLWKIEGVEGKPTEYRLINMYRNYTFASIGQSTNVQLNPNDTATVCFDWREDNAVAPTTGDPVTSFNIRSSSQAENGFNYMHTGGHNGGAGKEGWIVGWSDGGATRWYLSPIDEATAQEWMANSDNEQEPEIDSTIVEVDSTIVVPTDKPLITDASQLYSPFTCETEGSYEGAIDGDPSTFWHSDWTGGSVDGGHYLQIELTEPVTGIFSLYMMRRQASQDHPSLVKITGSNTSDFAETTFEINVRMPNAEAGLEAYSAGWAIDAPTRYLRVEALDCASSYGSSSTDPNYSSFRGYWHTSEIQIYQIGLSEGWLSDIAQYIAQLANFPVLQNELQVAYDAYISLPEGTSEDSINAVKIELFQIHTQIQKAQTCFAKLDAMIAMADSVLKDNNDEDLEEAFNAAKEIDAATSGSQDIINAYDALQGAYSVYLAMSVPMEEWNFTSWYRTTHVNYELDFNNGIARARIIDRNRSGLTELEIPKVIDVNGKTYAVVSVGHREINDWDAPSTLQRIVLPASIRNIEYAAFSEFSALHTVVVNATTPPSLDGNCGMDSYRIKICIPDNTLQDYQCANVWANYLLVQENLVEISVALPESGELGYLLMDKVEYLAEVNVLNITSGTLNSADWSVIKSLNNLIELNISECNNTVISHNQFQNSRLERILLPEVLEEIGDRAFGGCVRLVSIEIPQNVSRMYGWAFSGCYSLREVILSESLERLNYGTFERCDLRSVIIPSSCKCIESSVFESNRNLAEVIFKDGLEEIHSWAFVNCYSLKEVTLPSTLYYCSGSSFQNCDSLRVIQSNALIPPTADDCPLTDVDLAKVVLKVPSWSVTEYKLAPGWSRIPVIEASDYQPSTLYVFRDFKFRLAEEDASGYQPNIVMGWTDRYNDGNYDHGNLTINSSGKLNVNMFSMHYSPFAKHRDDERRNYNWYNQTKYNANSLVVKGEMRAEDVTITLMNIGDKWQFISFPFDVCMSDIVPVAGDSTQWVIREYSGYKRSIGQLDSTWVDLTSDDVLQAGKGYIMHCYNERANYDTPVMFQIKPNKESVNRQNIFNSGDAVTLLDEYIAEFDHNSSWNLVGNPYPCYYDTRFMDFTAPITVWNSCSENYQAYSPLDDDYVLNPGEAFFVQRPAETESITFNVDGRQTSIDARDLDVANARSTSMRSVFNITLSGDETSDRTRVVMNEEASMAYEMNRDASKFNALSSTAVQIYTVQGNIRMAINERPLGNASVELGMTIAVDGTYTISLQQANDKTVVLEDRLLGVRTELSAENSYMFNAKAGEIKKRFFLNFSGSNATGIDNLESENGTDEPAYNVAGQRVEDTQKGIVIKEGKKLLNK